MARVVIVRVSVYEHAAFHDLVAKIDPTGQFGRAIDGAFVPSGLHLRNQLAMSFVVGM